MQLVATHEPHATGEELRRADLSANRGDVVKDRTAEGRARRRESREED